jgi:PAS domain S-box-containing protein
VFANQRYAESNGWTVDSIIGKTVREAIGEEAWRTIEPQVERAFKGEKVEYQRAMILPDGERRTIEVSLIPHFDEAGKLLGAFVLITDITRHQLAEQAIRDSEERMRKFAAATNEGIFFHKNGILTDVNEALLTILGYTREEVIGHNALEFVPPEWQKEVGEYMRAGREDPYEAEVVHGNGYSIAVEMVGKTLHLGDETYRLGALRDITAHKHTGARIRHLAHHDMLTACPTAPTGRVADRSPGAGAAPRHAGGDCSPT